MRHWNDSIRVQDGENLFLAAQTKHTPRLRNTMKCPQLGVSNKGTCFLYRARSNVKIIKSLWKTTQAEVERKKTIWMVINDIT